MPAVSKVSIGNQAIINLGEDHFIEDPGEGTKQANLLNQLFDHAVDVVLAAHPWPFAKKRAALTELTNPSDHWSHCYRYPVDCVFARYIVSATDAEHGDVGMIEGVRGRYRIPFEIAGDDAAGRYIFTDQAEATLAYTKRIQDTQAFSAPFVDALAWYLAARMALPITKKPKIAEWAGKQYRLALDSAAATAHNEGQPVEKPESPSVRARLDA